MTDRRGVIAKCAEELKPGVPYVRGWAEAKKGAAVIAEQLSLLGLESDFPGLKPDVNVFGDGLVCLGTVRPEAAAMLAELIVSGLASEMAERASAVETERPDTPTV